MKEEMLTKIITLQQLRTNDVHKNYIYIKDLISKLKN